MPKETTIIDHLVYGVHDLTVTTDWFEEISGVRPVFGGYHTTQGTKNALIGLGKNCYLEFITIDSENKAVKPPRWMGIDLLEQPKMIRWAARAIDIDLAAQRLSEQRPELGILSEGQRKTTTDQTLRWRMSLPAAYPEVEVLPFLLDWSESTIHPSESLNDECQLLQLELTHPEMEQLQAQQPYLVNELTFKRGTVGIRALLKTPKGEVWI